MIFFLPIEMPGLNTLISESKFVALCASKENDNRIAKALSRAYFKQDLQLHKTWQSTMEKLHIYTAHFDIATAQIMTNCTLIHALSLRSISQLV